MSVFGVGICAIVVVVVVEVDVGDCDAAGVVTHVCVLCAMLLSIVLCRQAMLYLLSTLWLLGPDVVVVVVVFVA